MGSNRHKIGVDIIQPIVPEYRLALFKGLALEPELDVFVQASDRMGGDVSMPLPPSMSDYAHHMVKLWKLPLVWQRDLRLIKVRGPGDVLVVCGDLHQISTIPLILRARRKGAGVIWWGHHVSANPKAPCVAIRLSIARRLADCMLCYTDQGCQFLIRKGFAQKKVFATGNTIDLNGVKDAIAVWPSDKLNAFKKTHGLEGYCTIIFSSVLRRKTRLDILIQALAMLDDKHTKIKCVIVGDGEMRDEYRDLAQALNVSEKLVWVGAMRDQRVLAPWFLSASAYVYPGPIGLSLIHAFAYGLPVIVNDNASNHGPEYVVFEDENNGLVFREGDPTDLARVINRLLAMPDRMKKMGKLGKHVVFQDYSMTRMIARFKEAILACSNKKSL